MEIITFETLVHHFLLTAIGYTGEACIGAFCVAYALPLNQRPRLNTWQGKVLLWAGLATYLSGVIAAWYLFFQYFGIVEEITLTANYALSFATAFSIPTAIGLLVPWLVQHYVKFRNQHY